MPNPKSSNAPGAVSPAAPKEAVEADRAKPGEMDQNAGGAGSDGKPHKPEEEKKSWIEIVMVNEKGQPVAGMAYRIKLPDGGSIAEGTLNEQGFAKVSGIDPGNCQITFPTLDQEAWERA